MDKLINFINSFIDYSEVSQVKNKLILKFDYFEFVDQIMTYENILNLVETYPSSLKIFVKTEVFDEVNLVDFISDESEFNEAFKSFEKNKLKFQIIINYSMLINLYSGLNKINDEINLEVCYNEKLLLEKLDIKNNNYKELEDSLLKRNKNVFLLLDSDIFCYNENNLFTNVHREHILDEINFFKDLHIRDERKALELRSIACNWIEATKNITPNSIFIEFEKDDFCVSEEVKKLFIKINCNLVLLFISNYSGLDDGIFKSLISGNKRVEIIYDIEEYDYNAYINLNKIYNWIYGNPLLDKLNICRNVISALITAKCQGSRLKTILDNSDLLIKSLKDNYEVYSTENVEKYFEEKNKLKKEIQGEINSINNQLDNLIKILITNMTSLIGICIAGVVGYIAKGEFFSVKLLSVLYLIQLDINMILNLPIIIIRFREASKEFNIKVKEYGDLYFSDITLSKYKSKKSLNSTILIIYIVIATIIIVIINSFVIYLLNSQSFSEWIINILNK